MTKRVAWHSVNDRNLKFTDREPLWEGVDTVLASGKSILNTGRSRGACAQACPSTIPGRSTPPSFLTAKASSRATRGLDASSFLVYHFSISKFMFVDHMPYRLVSPDSPNALLLITFIASGNGSP